MSVDLSDRCLLVDLGCVACFFDHERRLDRMAKVLVRPAGQIDALIWQSGFDTRCDRGEIGREEVVRLFAAELSLLPSRDTIAAAAQAVGRASRYTPATSPDAVRSFLPGSAW